MILQVKLLSRVVETYHGAKPVSKSGSTIKYGPYSDIAPFSGGTLTVHFENNSPFLDVLSLTREIEVSHWGNVYVEEWYTVKHMGAQHKVSRTASWAANACHARLRPDCALVPQKRRAALCARRALTCSPLCAIGKDCGIILISCTKIPAVLCRCGMQGSTCTRGCDMSQTGLFSSTSLQDMLRRVSACRGSGRGCGTSRTRCATGRPRSRR